MGRLLIKNIIFGSIISIILFGCRQTNNTSNTNGDGGTTQPIDQEWSELPDIIEETTDTGIKLVSDLRLYRYKSVSAGMYHTIAIGTDGSLWAWGNNRDGQLGNGEEGGAWENLSANSNKPVRIGTDSDWAFTAAGSEHTIAVKTDGSLWGWGRNDRGQLGDGTLVNRSTPVRIDADLDWASVSAGDNFTVAIKTDGSLWSWGNNTFGQLGNGTKGSNRGSNIPVRIGTDSNWVSVDAGLWHTVAIRTDGSLWIWGDTNNITDGGRGAMSVTITHPTQVGTETGWVLAAAGDDHNVALKADGSLWSWGRNSLGALGHDTGRGSNDLIQIGTDKDWAYVTAHSYNTMAIKKDGTLWICGALGYYDIQAGELVTSPLVEYGNSPALVWEDIKWASVSSSLWYALAVSTDGSLWAWGINDFGQLGNGAGGGGWGDNSANCLIPVQIGPKAVIESMNGIEK